ncbi:hypothetical protein [Streptomyces sp. NBC_00038]|uniref:hypothetical protein n=1 Tax=Streptomyces sp. NBC_00038 TaxID=2903615 RepID=UPI002253AB35|nr:hypothetical protein [Streptomyces sp. NBC_00038]MCX5558231.1 hypothetical protein [Streptomyces sp. NBC_00038]
MEGGGGWCGAPGLWGAGSRHGDGPRALAERCRRGLRVIAGGGFCGCLGLRCITGCCRRLGLRCITDCCRRLGLRCITDCCRRRELRVTVGGSFCRRRRLRMIAGRCNGGLRVTVSGGRCG